MKKSLIYAIVGFVMAVFLPFSAVTADEQAITIDNPGFEDPVLAEDDYTWIDVPGWTHVGGDGPGVWNVTLSDFDPVLAPEGQNVLYTENAVGDPGGVTQVLTETFAAHTDYTLTVEVGNSWYYYFSGYSVQLLTGGVVIAEDNDTLWPKYYNWATSTVHYTYDSADAALVGQPLEIRLLTLALDKDNPPADEIVGVEFDNVKLSYGPPKARNPLPADGALVMKTWVGLSWTPVSFAVTNDVYMGDNFDDVNDGTGDTFQVSLDKDTLFYLTGITGNAYPDGLVNGVTYYWRIEGVNDTNPNSPSKGDVWSFTIVPKTAYSPNPAAGAEFVDLNVALNWSAGFDAKLHYIIFGEDFDEVNNAATGVLHGTTTYNPGPLKLAKTYYWRVDEYDGNETYKGDIWSFTTEGAVSGPNPADGAVDVKPTVVLSWDAGAVAASHEVYFGADMDAVKNATTASPEYKGPKALGEESYDPGMLTLNTTYFWRIDEVNGVSPDSPWLGNVWSFTTGDFFAIDDFEIYDANDNQIWWSWKDGLGYVAHDNEPAYPGNGTGSAVGDESTSSYTEETIVHGGLQSMPLVYDNNKQSYANYSEAELTLTAQRDWTEEGVAELSIWFRGNPVSVGSFVEDPIGTYTMTGSGADIWNTADEFHFAYKILTGPGSIIARVESVEQTDAWAKTGVMIRETLDVGSKFAAVYITPTNADGTATNGCRFQARLDTDAGAASDSTIATDEQRAIVAPYWVKLERDIGGNFRGYYSSNGSTWQSILWSPQFIPMSSNVYVGLALTSHNASATCEAKFSNVTITGNFSGQWANQDIGIESNAAEPLYVALSNTAGTPAVVVHDDPAAATIETWTEWVIPLQTFADQGIVLTNVDKIAIGLGTKDNWTIPGGSGKIFIDEIRLYRPREFVEE